jgi:hypothetical protein
MGKAFAPFALDMTIMKTAFLYRSIARKLLGGILFILLAQINTAVYAQFPLPPAQPRLCDAKVCFANPAARADYERENKCVFGNKCGDELITDSTRQCCGGDPNKEGKQKIQDKFQTTESDILAIRWWNIYKKQCPNMTQNTAPPDALWAQCHIGEKHNPAKDDWNVAEVVKNGSARDYCVDGCSTPRGIVNKLFLSGIFLFEDKDDPTGKGATGNRGVSTSFYNACAAHDRCYQTCSIGVDQNACDDKLLEDMLRVCESVAPMHTTTYINNLGFSVTVFTRNSCITAANKMHTGLDAAFGAGGSGAFRTRRTQYCQCCS